MPVVHQTSLAITSISDTNLSCVMTSAGLLKVVVVGPNPLKKVLSRIYAIQAKIESLWLAEQNHVTTFLPIRTLYITIILVTSSMVRITNVWGIWISCFVRTRKTLFFCSPKRTNFSARSDADASFAQRGHLQARDSSLVSNFRLSRLDHFTVLALLLRQGRSGVREGRHFQAGKAQEGWSLGPRSLLHLTLHRQLPVIIIHSFVHFL